MPTKKNTKNYNIKEGTKMDIPKRRESLKDILEEEMDILSKECLKKGRQYFQDKEFFIQETRLENPEFVEFLFIYYNEKIKIFKRKRNQQNFELNREIPRNNIKEIWRISQNGKVLLVELDNGKYQFLKERSSPVYYDNITLVESYVICKLGKKQYLCDLNGLDVKKDYVITYRDGNYIKLIKNCKTQKDKSYIQLILKEKSYYEIENINKFKKINIMVLEVKNDSNTEKGIYLKNLKGSPIVEEKIKATLKSCHTLKGKCYLKNQNQEFEYLSINEKNERNTKREFGGKNKTFEKKEYLVIPIFENTEHISVALEDLIKFRGNIKEDDVEEFEKKKKEHIEYKKVLYTLKIENVMNVEIYIVALYKNYSINKEFLRIIYMTKDKRNANGVGTYYEIKERSDLEKLQFYKKINKEINSEIEILFSKYIENNNYIS